MWFNPDLQTNIENTESQEQIELSKLAECMFLWECLNEEETNKFTNILDDFFKNLEDTPKRVEVSNNLNEFYKEQEEQVA